jgi:hypothetical protein
MKIICRCFAFSASLVFALVCGSAVSRAQVVSVTCANNASTDANTLNTAIGNAYTAYGSPNTNFTPPGPQIQIHGLCLVNQPIVLYGGMSYVGDTKLDTVIKQASSANLQAIVVDYSWTLSGSSVGDNVMRLAHLKIDGNRSANTSGTCLVVRSWNSTFEDLEIANCAGQGLLFSSAAQDGTILQTGSNMVNNVFRRIFIHDVASNGFNVSDNGSSGSNLTDNWLLDNTIADPGGSAITMDNSAGWVIRGNHVYHVPGSGIAAGRSYGTTIDSNFVENFGVGGTTGTNYYGIQCREEPGPGSVISNNKIFQIGGQGSGTFYFINVNLVGGTGYVNTIGNLLTGASLNDTGLYFENTAGGGTMLNYLSTGNQVSLMTIPIKHDTLTTAATPY